MKLEAGDKLKRIRGCVDDTEGSLFVELGFNSSSITVVDVAGQMAYVPWACCKMDNGETWMINLANVESVTLLDDDTPSDPWEPFFEDDNRE